MTRLGIVTGLAFEAACIRRAARTLPKHDIPPIFCAGASAERAREGASRLVADGARALVSFGIAGALAPELRPGDLILAQAVIAPDGSSSPVDPEWRERLRLRAADAPAVVGGSLVGQDRVIVSPEEKSALFEATGAVAVDMESHGVAAAARAAGVPFLVVRAIADPAERVIPSTALHGIGPDGRKRVLPVIGRLFAKPWEIVPLIRLGAESRAAMRTLGRVAALDARGFAIA